MVRGKRWKLVYYPQIDRYQLFDTIDDPDELLDRSGDESMVAIRDQLKQRMQTWFAERGDRVFVRSAN